MKIAYQKSTDVYDRAEIVRYEDLEDYVVEDTMSDDIDTSVFLKKCFKLLNERQIKVLSLRFGFETNAMMYTDIAKEMNISPSRVQQIEAKALRIMRQAA